MIIEPTDERPQDQDVPLTEKERVKVREIVDSLKQLTAVAVKRRETSPRRERRRF